MANTFAFTTRNTLLPFRSSSTYRTSRTPVCTAPLQPIAATKKTPVHRRLPVLGFLIDMLRLERTPLVLRREFGPIYESDYLGLPVTIISDRNAISAIFKDSKTFITEDTYPSTLLQLLGQNVLMGIDGHFHDSRRAAVLPAFNVTLFPNYFQVIRNASTSLWLKVSHQTTKHPNIPLKTFVNDHFFRTILNITAGDYFSELPLHQRESLVIDLRDKFILVTNGLVSLPFSPNFRKAMRARNSLIEYVYTFIQHRLENSAEVIETLRSVGPDDFVMATRKFLRKGSLDLTTVLCANSDLQTGPDVQNDPAQLKDLAEQVIFLWFAGYSTQSSATLSAILEAGRSTETWRRLREEQDRLVEKSGRREITYEQVSKEMPLMDSFVNEILRVYPPATAMLRKAAKDTVVAGHSVAKGTRLTLDIWGSQRDESLYPDANKIIIDRFVKQEGKESIPPIISFGAPGGVHFCIGAALAKIMIKDTLAKMIRDFDMELDPTQTMKYNVIPHLTPRSGVVVKSCAQRKHLKSNTA